MIKFDEKKPLIMAHAGGKALGPENSIEAINKSLPYNPDLIEIDVRESKDGILFCYHGFPTFPFFILAFVLRYIKFSSIKKLLPKVNSLEEILGTFTTPLTFFLDFKEHISSSSKLAKLKEFKQHRIWLAGHHLGDLKKWNNLYGRHFIYYYNFSFFRLKKGIKKALEAKVHGIKMFPWQLTKKNIAAVLDAGLAYSIHPFMISSEKYRKLALKWGSLWLCADDPSKPEILHTGL